MGTLLRASLWYGLAFILAMVGASTMIAQRSPELENERRFTSLETTMVSIAADVKDLKAQKEWEWLKSACMTLLVAAEGNRAYRRRKGFPD